MGIPKHLPEVNIGKFTSLNWTEKTTNAAKNQIEDVMDTYLS